MTSPWIVESGTSASAGSIDRLVAVERALDEAAAVGREVPELRAQLRQPRHVPEEGTLRERMREAGERLVEPGDRGADRAAGARARQGRAGGRRRR